MFEGVSRVTPVTAHIRVHVWFPPPHPLLERHTHTRTHSLNMKFEKTLLSYVVHLCVCVCVCACMHACVCVGVCARVCVCVCSRVQQEQLAAIFLLLKENQEVLGEVTEGDMEEQLKLYSL